MYRDITFCNNRNCPKTDCLRYYRNVPFDVIASWFHTNPEHGKCSYYLKEVVETGGKKNEIKKPRRKKTE